MATVTNPSYAPGVIATSQLQYGAIYNDLNISDPALLPTLKKIYGVENYTMVLEYLNNKGIIVTDTVQNKKFYHYENRPVHASVAVASQVTGTSAGTLTNSITIASADHLYSGTKSPARVGEVVQVASTLALGQITEINVATPSAHTFKVKPLNTGVAFASASGNIDAGEIILFRGAVNIGEGSAKISGLSPVIDKIENTTTEHRDDFPISDVADMEKTVIPLANGSYAFYDYAVQGMNIRYKNNEFFKLMEGPSVNNISGTFGTVGVIPRTQANGINVQYSAGSLTFADLQALTRAIMNFGAAGEYHLLCDINFKQAITSVLSEKFSTLNGATYASVGGSAEAAASYGFDTLRMDSTTLHLFSNPMFNPSSIYQRTITNNGYSDFCLAIPQRINQDAKDSSITYPSFQIVYQKPVNEPAGTKIKTWDTGANSVSGNKTDVAERVMHMLSYPGVRIFGARQFAIIKGS